MEFITHGHYQKTHISPMRINKYIATQYNYSRREADEIIARGDVYVNGNIVDLGYDVQPSDIVTVHNQQQTAPKVIYAYNKPRTVVTVCAQPNEQEISDVTKFPEDVFPIGRLDKDSEGLILMTNDRTLPDHILGSHIEKEYRVTVDKPITHSFLVHMRHGVDIKTKKHTRGRSEKQWHTTAPTKIRRTSPITFDIVLAEGKNRQIRRMCSSLGYHVKKLQRIRIGTIHLENLKPKQFRRIDHFTM